MFYHIIIPQKKSKSNTNQPSLFSGNSPISMSFRTIASFTGKNVIEKKIGKQLPLLTEQLSEKTVRHAFLKMYTACILQLVLHGQGPLLCSALLEFLLLSWILEIMGLAKAHVSAIRVVIAGSELLLLFLSPSMSTCT